ncbi:hypothetical protein MTR67_001958 [Solanum verrucosum]|uniref:Uncharacterized protein n=1 Tax=Solanum verrucosum TaxID=315347 RepID=A0AAF0T8X5_SOLVR|nr:hypothetical protein MTR67_001958 [Solanum verrucosum]
MIIFCWGYKSSKRPVCDCVPHRFMHHNPLDSRAEYEKITLGCITRILLQLCTNIQQHHTQHNQHVLHKTLNGGKAKSRKVPQREIEAGVGGKLQQFNAPKLASPRKLDYVLAYAFFLKCV